MTDIQEQQPSGDLPPQPEADNGQVEAMLAKLRTIPGHDLDEARLRAVTAHLADGLAYRKKQRPDKINNTDILDRLGPKAEGFQNALGRRGMPVTPNQAVAALPAYFLHDPDSTAEKLAQFIAACKNDHGISLDYLEFVDTPSLLFQLSTSALLVPLRNIVKQHEMLTQNGIEIEQAVYIKKIFKQQGKGLGFRPEAILDRARFVLEAYDLGRIPLSPSMQGNGEKIIKNMYILGIGINHLAAALIYIRLAPILLPKSKRVLLSFATLSHYLHRSLVGEELAIMLGMKNSRKVFNPDFAIRKAEKADLAPALEKLRQESHQKKLDLFTLLVKLGFIPGYELDPEFVPPEVKDIKRGTFGTETPERQRQRYYARDYFGEGADQLSVFGLYRKVIQSEPWSAVVTPAQEAIARHAAQQHEQKQNAAAAAQALMKRSGTAAAERAERDRRILAQRDARANRKKQAKEGKEELIALAAAMVGNPGAPRPASPEISSENPQPRWPECSRK